MANSFASAQVSVGTTATLLVPATNPFQFQEAVIYNPGPATVAFGGSDVTAAMGNIPAGGSLSIDIAQPDDAPYGRVASGTQIVHVFRQRLQD
jgi:hypothetical protein